MGNGNFFNILKFVPHLWALAVWELPDCHQVLKGSSVRKKAVLDMNLSCSLLSVLNSFFCSQHKAIVESRARKYMMLPHHLWEITVGFVLSFDCLNHYVAASNSNLDKLSVPVFKFYWQLTIIGFLTEHLPLLVWNCLDLNAPRVLKNMYREVLCSNSCQ